MARQFLPNPARAEGRHALDCAPTPRQTPAAGEVARFSRVEIPQAETLSIPAEQLQLGPVRRVGTLSTGERKCCRLGVDPSRLEISSSKSPSLSRNGTMDGGIDVSSIGVAISPEAA
jgi:hypothetical protein